MAWRTPEIVDGRIVEAFFPADQMNPGILRKLSVIPEDLLGATVILHNDDLVIFVGSFFKKWIPRKPEAFLSPHGSE